MNKSSERVGLAVAEMQVLHYGHIKLLSLMASTVDTAIIALGSAQLSNVPGHPLSWDARKDCIKSVFGNRFKIVPLRDIATSQPEEWMDYVLNALKRADMPVPTDCFCGSEAESYWYHPYFLGNQNLDQCERTDHMMHTTYSNKNIPQKLHILDRDVSSKPVSGRDIRTMIEMRDERWKTFVPLRIHDLIEDHYPGTLRKALQFAGSFPEHSSHSYPVGTQAYLSGENNILYELMDDGKWRKKPQLDEKSKFALNVQHMMKRS